MSFPKFVTMTKNTPFFPFPILHVFATLHDVHAYIAWSWKTTLITWFFYEDDIQLQMQVPPGLFLWMNMNKLQVAAKVNLKLLYK